jgi:hypothetical protein
VPRDFTESERHEEKVCRTCGKVKPVSAFLRRADSPDGYRHQCVECQRSRAKPCTFSDCENPRKRGGLCDAHAKQRDRGSDLSPIGSRQGGLNREDAIAAREELLALGFSPSIPYPGTMKPWPGVCLNCGRPGSPTLRNVRHVDSSPCGYCAGQVVDDDLRIGRMLAVGYEPLEPCPGSLRRWRCLHDKCGQVVEVKWSEIFREGSAGGCPACRGLVVVRGFNDLATTRPPSQLEVVAALSGNARRATAGLRPHKVEQGVEVVVSAPTTDSTPPNVLRSTS